MTTLEFVNVSKRYRVRGASSMLALDDVSFTLHDRETIALVGQSGSGKSTIAKILTQLETPTSGQVLLDSKPVPRHGKGLRSYRQTLRMIFQDPFASLNPYHSIRYHLERPLQLDHVVPKADIEAEVRRLLERATSGDILLDGKAIPRRGRALRRYRQQVRMVFQDPFASLNPSHTIRHHLERPLRLDHVVPEAEVEDEVHRLLERVQLDPAGTIDRRPHELSGGQRQRVAIARALASRPALLVADEPVSMLDVSIRLGVLNLLADLQPEEGLGVLYITHDLATARHFSDRIMVLHHGRVVEHGTADDVILNPQHEYTRELRAASPDPEKHFATAPTNAQGGVA